MFHLEIDMCIKQCKLIEILSAATCLEEYLEEIEEDEKPQKQFKFNFIVKCGKSHRLPLHIHKLYK